MRFIWQKGLSVGESFSRYSDHGAAGWSFLEDNSAGADHCFLAYYSAGERNGADPDVSELTNAHATAEDGAG
jgi:hypothetical protein